MTSYLLSLLIWIPLLAAVVVLLLPRRWSSGYKYVALAVSVVQLILLIPLLQQYNPMTSSPDRMSGFQFVEYYNWINLDLGTFGHLSSHYFLGVDGINIWMIILSVVVLLFSVISSFSIHERPAGYYSLFLLLNGAVIGCFTALDFLLFYIFFEFMLLPMFFLIGLWGGKRRDYASIKFFLYTLFGSLLILIVMVMLYISVADPMATGELAGIHGTEIIPKVQKTLNDLPDENVVHTFNMIYMTDQNNLIDGSILAISNENTFLGMKFRDLAFLLIFIGFSIKIPLVPVHTWLPDAHVEAPTAISVVLAGILLKVGGYGLIRSGFMIFPDGAVSFSWIMGLLGVISIIYGAMNALASQDLKRLVAYSSISHMGFVALGLASGTSEGISGAIYQMVSHGIISAALFLLVGVLYDRTHDRIISNFSGLAQKIPAFTVLSVIFFFASMALPGFSGFIAEILVLLGAFASETLNGLIPRWMMIVAALGMIVSAAYYLWTLQRMYFGEFYVRHYVSELPDLSLREYVMLIPLALMTLVLGLFPSVLLDLINPAVNELVAFISEHGMGVIQ